MKPILMISGFLFCRLPRRLHWFALLIIAVSQSASSSASEQILLFLSDVVVTEDGQMHITETITVNAEGDKIKRGIYRDIPVRYGDGSAGGDGHFIPFQIASIECDDQPVAYHVDKKHDFQRVYIGQKNVTVAQGKHTYVIRYITRQLRSFPEHDEVYWNATGNGWVFSIEKAVATVTLPAAIPLDKIDAEGYVGGLRSKNQKDLTVEIDAARRQTVYRTALPLQPGEGLTVVARFPPGYITHQTVAAGHWADPLIPWGSAALAITVGYFVFVWFLVGRDPPAGVILPRYEPPEGLSASACRFIFRMGYDNECFSVAILSLATQGALTIRNYKGRYVLKKTGDPSATASLIEKMVFAKLLSDKSHLGISNVHHAKFSRTIELLRQNLVTEFQGHLFRSNRIWFYVGVFITVTAVLGAILFSGIITISDELIRVNGWLTFWSLGTGLSLSACIFSFRSFSAPSSGLRKIIPAAMTLVTTLIAVAFVGMELYLLWWLSSLTSFWLIPLVGASVATVVIFRVLLKAPTRAGRAMMDEISGFRMYLATAEQERLDALTHETLHSRKGPEPKRFELFERFLPYAVALDVAGQWAEQFHDLVGAACIDTTAQNQTGYQPDWYQGEAWSTDSFGAAVAGFGTAMGAELAGAAVKISSSDGTSSGYSDGDSGGGGGGFSGGGGGGGGGGGW